MTSSASNKNPSPIDLVNSWSDNYAQYQELSWRNFIITRRLAKSAPAGAEFLPSNITQGGREIWRFDKDSEATMAFLREYDNEPVLALSTPRKLLDVLFIADITLIMTVKIKGGKEKKIPARSLIALALCKRELAKDLAREPVYTSDEMLVLKAHDQKVGEEARRKAHDERSDNLRKKEEGRVASIAVHEGKVKSIMNRQEVRCFTVDYGQPRRGRPVVGNEWECLKNSTFCILVDSYDNETGKCGNLIESFRVRKDGAKAKRQDIEKVQLERVENAVAGDIEAEDVETFTVNGEAMLMPVYVGVKPSLIKLLQPFAIREEKVDTVYRRKENGSLETIGHVRRQVLQAQTA